MSGEPKSDLPVGTAHPEVEATARLDEKTPPPPPTATGGADSPKPVLTPAGEADRYEELQVLGEGGMGTVYKARDRRLDRLVALKRLLPKMAASKIALKRFLTEAKAVAALNHPNIVQIYDIGRDTRGFYISMELVQGPNLQQRLQAEGALKPDEAVDLTVHLADALHLAHQHGIIHRDIKPANVLCGAGAAKLTDFGLARRLDVSHRTIAGTLLGTIEFVAPEQRENASRADQASDQYSLAGMFYYMVTGKLPLVVRPELLPEAVREVILRALEPEAAKRYPSTLAFGEALRAAWAARNSRAASDSPVPGRCSKCGTPNDPQRKFCLQCGADLVFTCFSCGSTNAATARFCGACGLDLHSHRQQIEKQLTEWKTQADALLTQGSVDQALAIFQRIAQVSHSAFRLQRAEAQQRIHQLTATQRNVQAYYQRLYQQAVADFYAGQYARVIQAVEGCPPALRQKPLLQLLQQARQMVNRINELNAQLKAAVAQRDIPAVLRLLDKLEPLEPRRQDLKRLRAEALQLQAAAAAAVPAPSPTPPPVTPIAPVPEPVAASSSSGGSAPGHSAEPTVNPASAATPPGPTAPPKAADDRPAARYFATVAQRIRRRPWPLVAAGAAAVGLIVVSCWALGAFASRPAGPRLLPPDVLAQHQTVADIAAAAFPVGLNQTAEVGDLTVQPLSIHKQTIRLLWLDPTQQARTSAGPVLVLTLQVTNRGSRPLAPLDKELARRTPNTFIALAGGNRVGPYPLDVASEYDIEGQYLGKIAPGQSQKLIVVADERSAQAAAEAGDSLTWYVHLRSGVDGTSAILAVAFQARDVK